MLEKTQTTQKTGKIDLKRIAKDLGNAGDLIDSLKDTVKAQTDQEYPSDENIDRDALAAQEQGGSEEEAEVAAAEGDKELQQAADKEAAETAAQEAPPEEEASAGDEPTPKAPETKSEEDVVGNLAGLEAMIADIAADLNTKDERETE